MRLRRLRRFRKDDQGNVTVAFVISLPVLLIVFAGAFEVGLLMTRQVMLDRGVDLAARAVRLNTHDPVEADDLRRMICNGASILPDCLNTVKVEMLVVDPETGLQVSATPDCVDRSQEVRPAGQSTSGDQNDLMFFRACAILPPIFANFGLGQELEDREGDGYALVSMSAFVMEPLP